MPPSDEYGVSTQQEPSGADPVAAIYRRALPEVYGYLLPRCGSTAVAEDLTAETFKEAVQAAQSHDPPRITVASLVGVARHKLVDHWRRTAREERAFAVSEQAVLDDPRGERVETEAAYAALSRVSADQRIALTLRYLDGLSVAEVAEHLGRSVRATETLLARARAALRRVYREGAGDDV
jgi:RNA polymerase sigma-70 factor (ECF subfamily)